MKTKFLEAMYTMLFIEMRVHSYSSDMTNDEFTEICMKAAYAAAKTATDYWYAKNKEPNNDNE